MHQQRRRRRYWAGIRKQLVHHCWVVRRERQGRANEPFSVPYSGARPGCSVSAQRPTLRFFFFVLVAFHVMGTSRCLAGLQMGREGRVGDVSSRRATGEREGLGGRPGTRRGRVDEGGREACAPPTWPRRSCGGLLRSRASKLPRAPAHIQTMCSRVCYPTQLAATHSGHYFYTRLLHLLGAGALCANALAPLLPLAFSQGSVSQARVSSPAVMYMTLMDVAPDTQSPHTQSHKHTQKPKHMYTHTHKPAQACADTHSSGDVT